MTQAHTGDKTMNKCFFISFPQIFSRICWQELMITSFLALHSCIYCCFMPAAPTQQPQAFTLTVYTLCQTAASSHIQQPHGQMFSIIHSVVSISLINRTLLSCWLGLQRTPKERSHLDNQVLANCIGFLIYWKWTRACSDPWHRRTRLYGNLCKTSTRALDTHREATTAKVPNSLVQVNVQTGFFQDFKLQRLRCRLSHWQNHAHLILHKLTVLGYCYAWKQQGNKQHGQLCFRTIRDKWTLVCILI